jgi:hypothetical protein
MVTHVRSGDIQLAVNHDTLTPAALQPRVRMETDDDEDDDDDGDDDEALTGTRIKALGCRRPKADAD